MAFQIPRIILYTLLALFSLVLLGLTASRINYTRRLNSVDPLRRSRGYEPIVAELLSTSIISFLWSLPIMICIGTRAQAGYASSYFMEILGLSILFVLYLVGAAIFSHDYSSGVSRCRGVFTQCRVMTGIQAFSWINWVIVFLLLLLTLASFFKRRAALGAPFHGHRDTTAAGAAGGYGVGSKTEPGVGHRGGNTLAGGAPGNMNNTTAPAAGNTVTGTGPGTGGYANTGPEMRYGGAPATSNV